MRKVRRHYALPGGNRQRGFTLLEVLLAFVVFAISFATVLEIVGASSRSTMRAKDYSEAALLAQSLMDSVGTEVPIQAGSWDGEAENGFLWSLEITDFEGLEEDARTLEIAEMNGTLLYWVDLRLQWNDGIRDREATFTSIRGTVGQEL